MSGVDYGAVLLDLRLRKAMAIERHARELRDIDAAISVAENISAREPRLEVQFGLADSIHAEESS